MTQALVWLHDSDPTVPEIESNFLYYHIFTNHVCASWPLLTQGIVEVPLYTPTHDNPLLASTTELPQGTFAEDAY